MRGYCISSFNRTYNLNYSLKDKEEGRNIDINVASMRDYNKFRKEQEKHKKQLKELIKGKILYIDNYTGYLGHKEIKGPYGEEEIFIPEYTSNNLSLIEIIIDIENKIKNNKKKIRK